jgi:hypothetical protein
MQTHFSEFMFNFRFGKEFKKTNWVLTLEIYVALQKTLALFKIESNSFTEHEH